MKIGKSLIGSKYPVFIIAEAGINHNGDIEIAKEMINQAKLIGADAIKFQTIFPDELYSKHQNQNLYKLINDWSFNKKQHIELMKFARGKKIEFISTKNIVFQE